MAAYHQPKQLAPDLDALGINLWSEPKRTLTYLKAGDGSATRAQPIWASLNWKDRYRLRGYIDRLRATVRRWITPLITHGAAHAAFTIHPPTLCFNYYF